MLRIIWKNKSKHPKRLQAAAITLLRWSELAPIQMNWRRLLHFKPTQPCPSFRPIPWFSQLTPSRTIRKARGRIRTCKVIATKTIGALSTRIFSRNMMKWIRNPPSLSSSTWARTSATKFSKYSLKKSKITKKCGKLSANTGMASRISSLTQIWFSISTRLRRAIPILISANSEMIRISRTTSKSTTRRSSTS